MQNVDRTPQNLVAVYNRLLNYYGTQNWWPAEHSFEVIVGAILTQNTAWTNVELALENLRRHDCLSYEEILKLPIEALQSHIRPAGFYRRKASCIRTVSQCLQDCRGIEVLRQQEHQYSRELLLGISGIGEETADAILLYALDKPAFVIDKYTRRIMSRLGLLDASCSYQTLQQVFVSQLGYRLELFQEYHALLVEQAKTHCRKIPHCTACPLRHCCRHFITSNTGHITVD